MAAIDRALAVMEALKGGPVTNQQALGWVDDFIRQYRPDLLDENGDPAGALTPDQKARIYINANRQHHRNVRRTVRLPSAAETAREAEAAAVDQEVSDTLGDDENEPTP